MALAVSAGLVSKGLELGETTHRYDYVSAYVQEFRSVLDIDAIRGSELTLGVDPLVGPAWRIGSRSPSAMAST